MMELRDLRAFALLGDVLHFRLTAERLHITQSALTKQIQRLEAEFGGALFERGPRLTRLTPLGRVTHTDAKTIVESANRLAHRAQLAAQGVLGTLRIGFGLTTRTIAPRAIAAFRVTMPHVQIELREMSARHQIEAIKNGVLDVGFCRLPVPEGWPTVPVLRDSLLAILPSEIPEDSSLEDLVKKPFVMIDRSGSPAFHDHMMSYLARRGVFVHTVQTVSDFSTALSLVEAGVGWAIVPSSICDGHPGLREKRFNDPSAEWEVGLVCPPGPMGVIVEAFWAVVVEACSHATGAPRPPLSGLDQAIEA
jgi:DNA-binding transcriptional LysR family regulator